MRLIPPPTDADVARLKRDCAIRYGRHIDEVRIVHAPYRLCPIGAHIDHQLGPVSAISVAHGIQVAFVAHDGDCVEIASDGFAGTFRLPLHSRQIRAGDWGDYARGAIGALSAKYSLPRGVSLLIRGHLSEAGLSSSAAVGLGYLLAIATANDLTLEAAALIELDRAIENDFLGLKNGVLDPSAIALAQTGRLTVIDCATRQSTHVGQEDTFVFLAVYSGLKEGLTQSGKFNDRVDECLRAGAMLANYAHGTALAAAPLGRVSISDWQRYASVLDGSYRRRAEHFFSESVRVWQGADAWAASDRAAFGDLMTRSGFSSIENYQTGSPEMIRLFEILNATPGVWGARFSGAGFRGCAVALIEAAQTEDILAAVEAAYVKSFPVYRDSLWALSSTACQGLRLL
jgi:galacturonokinase